MGIISVEHVVTTNDFNVFWPDNASPDGLDSKQAARILWIKLTYTAAAGAGNRQAELRVRKVNTPYYTKICPINIAATEVRHIYWAPGVEESSAFDANDCAYMKLPSGLCIPPGGEIQLLDANTVSAADDLTFDVAVEYFDQTGA